MFRVAPLARALSPPPLKTAARRSRCAAASVGQSTAPGTLRHLHDTIDHLPPAPQAKSYTLFSLLAPDQKQPQAHGSVSQPAAFTRYTTISAGFRPVPSQLREIFERFVKNTKSICQPRTPDGRTAASQSASHPGPRAAQSDEPRPTAAILRMAVGCCWGLEVFKKMQAVSKHPEGLCLRCRCDANPNAGHPTVSPRRNQGLSKHDWVWPLQLSCAWQRVLDVRSTIGGLLLAWGGKGDTQTSHKIQGANVFVPFLSWEASRFGQTLH